MLEPILVGPELAEPGLPFITITGICNPMPIWVSLSTAVLWLVGFAVNAGVSGARGNPRRWEVYGGDPAGRKHSALDQINRANVHRLKPVWIHHCEDMRLQPASTIECNPIVVDGVMFLTTPGLKVVALDAATGRSRWAFDPWNGQGGRGVNRGVTYWSSGEDRRIFFVAGNQLCALNATNGQLVATFGSGGKVDLRDGLDRDVFFLSVTAT